MFIIYSIKIILLSSNICDNLFSLVANLVLQIFELDTAIFDFVADVVTVHCYCLFHFHLHATLISILRYDLDLKHWYSQCCNQFSDIF